MIGMRKVNHAWKITIPLVMFILLGLSLNSAGQFEPDITIAAQSPVEVRVAPGRINFTHTSGNVTCESYGSAPIVVSYHAICTIGRITVNPPMGVFNGGETEVSNITVTVDLPRGTSSYARPVATINGTWEQAGLIGEVNPIDVEVIVVPYSRVQTDCEESVRENNPGDETVFDVQIENRGNRDDVYLINITNREELEDEGITIDHVNEVAMGEGNTSEIPIRVRTPPDILGNWQRGSFGRTYSIHYRVSSNISDDPRWDEDVLVLRVEMDAPTYAGIIFSCPGTYIITIVFIILLIYVYRERKKNIVKGKPPEDETPKE